MRSAIQIGQVIDLLNAANELDPKAMAALVAARVECNEALTEHPTIQCGGDEVLGGEYTVGLVGILNGLFGVDARQYGAISARVREDGSIECFELLDNRRLKCACGGYQCACHTWCPDLCACVSGCRCVFAEGTECVECGRELDDHKINNLVRIA